MSLESMIDLVRRLHAAGVPREDYNTRASYCIATAMFVDDSAQRLLSARDAVRAQGLNVYQLPGDETEFATEIWVTVTEK